jgi:hypothetical protein
VVNAPESSSPVEGEVRLGKKKKKATSVNKRPKKNLNSTGGAVASEGEGSPLMDK